MAFKFNPITGQLDLVNSNNTPGSGNVTGVPPTDPNAIARWVDTAGTTIENSPGTYVQDGGAIQSSGFMTNRTITSTISIPDGYSMISSSLELELGGSIELEPNGELIIV